MHLTVGNQSCLQRLKNCSWAGRPQWGLLLAAALTCLALLSGCLLKREIVITGRTMGTTYTVKIVAHVFKNTDLLKKKIDERLKEINQSMSTYLPDSEISRFNALHRIDEKFEVSEDFLHVMIVAADLYNKTGGAWDGTVKPLVNLWGFGNAQQKNTVPSIEEIDLLKRNIGFHLIRLSEEGYLFKRHAKVTLDLASIAKGFGVDQIAELLRAEGVANFLVEIGGEIYAAGQRRDKRAWRVGINQPRKAAAMHAVHKVIDLQNKALATSGDYRNFFEIDGRRYSHVLDPKTGYPVSNGVVSVSIVADTCTFADGLATAVMVMGHEKGLALVKRLSGAECLIVVRESTGELVDYYSEGFTRIFLN